MDAMEFFQHSAGRWRSQRTTHHLPFRRTETGSSEIQVEALTAADPQVVEICQLHGVEPERAIGGAFVRWSGSMAWDRDTETHEGTTVFALVPDPEDSRRGQLLRDRGYAEIVPVVGQYQMDGENALILTTEYETMSSTERFWFAAPDLRLRSSTVKRFGGLSTASFSSEARITTPEDSGTASPGNPPQEERSTPTYRLWGW